MSLSAGVAALPYCERLVAGTEPWNVASNVAFALLGLYALGRRSASIRSASGPGEERDAASAALVALPFVIALGSALYHAYPSPATQLLDLVPIALFVAFALWLALRRVLHVSMRAAVTTLALWLVATLLVAPFPEIAHGSLVYVPTLVSLVALGPFAARRSDAGRGQVRALGAIALVFAVALVVRTLDAPLCPWSPVGTHPLWHVLVAASGALAARLVLPVTVVSRRAESSGRPRPRG